MSARKLSDAPKAPGTRETRRQERLAERRRRIRRIERTILWGLGLSCIAGAVWLLWHPAIRVAEITVSGEGSEERVEAISAIAHRSVAGFYGYVLPRDSIFFLPEKDIRARILDTYPDIAAVSVNRERFDAISVTVFPRIPAFIWCGADREAPEPCLFADSEGFLFADADTASTSLLTFYASLENAATEPLRATVARAKDTPGVFWFVRTIAELGLSTEAVVLRGDEADVHLRDSDTRITYVLADEQGAAALVAIALKNLPAPLHTFEYIDVRFPGKAYFKEKE